MSTYARHLVLLAILLFLSAPLWASQTRYVVGFGTDAGNDCTDQNFPCQTIPHAVNQSSSGDTIAIFAGTYTIAPLTLNNRELHFLGQGAGPGGTIIQVQPVGPTDPVGRVLNLIGGADIVIENMWLRHGNSLTTSTNRSGGGISVSGGSLELIDSLISDNRAESGGAIFLINGAELIIDNSEIRASQADVDGGGIRAVGGSTIEVRNGSRIVDNDAGTHGGGVAAYSNTSLLVHGGSEISNNRSQLAGGGITSGNPQGPSGGQVTLLDAVISDNRAAGGIAASPGGGMYIRSGTVEIQGARIENNFSEGIGGGIAHSLGSLSLVEATVSGNESNLSGGGIAVGVDATASVGHSTIMNNRASGSTGQGGGIRLAANPEVVIFNSTITGNIAWVGAGLGIQSNGGSLALLHTTITDNQTTGNSGAVRFNQQEGVVVSVGNTLIANQRGQTTDCHGEAPSIGGNISSDESCGFSDGTDSENAYAGLLPLFDNGGATLTHAIRPESHAVGAGDITICTDGPVFGADQRYETRPQNSFCDIGAYELNQLLLQFAITSLPEGDWNEAYEFFAEAVGGETPYVWTVMTPGGLPQGLTLDSFTGEITGTPTAIGNFDVTLAVSDGFNQDERDFVLMINGPDQLFDDRFEANME